MLHEPLLDRLDHVRPQSNMAAERGPQRRISRTEWRTELLHDDPDLRRTEATTKLSNVNDLVDPVFRLLRQITVLRDGKGCSGYCCGRADSGNR